MNYIIEKVRDLVDAAEHLAGAGVNRDKKVSSGGKVFIGNEYAGERGDVIFVPEEKQE